VSDPTPALTAKNLRHSFAEGDGQKTVLDGVSLELYRGEMTLIMGPSGSGKTTLLGALAGLMRPDTGEVEALGRPLWGLSEAARRDFRREHCGYVFQGHNLFPALTARQQLEIVLRWGLGRGGRLVRREAEELLGRLGLGPRQLDQRPQALSGGEKQRVAIGRALVKKPALCFADEPTAALDWDSGRNVAGLLRDAARAGAAVLVITHDGRLRDFADRVYYLRNGRLTETPDASHMGEACSPTSQQPGASPCRHPFATTLEV
jgi:putative ABC transport system ATP-binding protein